MRLNRTTGHALRVMLACAEHEDRLVKAADLAQLLDLSLQNILKIIHMLSRQGLIVGQRGRHGGARLARPAASISVGDVVRALELLELDDEDEAGNGSARRDLEPAVNTLLDDALLAFVAVLEKHSLADMLAMRAVPAKTRSRRDTKSRPELPPAKKVKQRKVPRPRPEL